MSMVDLDVPVTAIDEVFVEDSCTNTPDYTSEIREKSFVWSEAVETKGTKSQTEAPTSRLPYRAEIKELIDFELERKNKYLHQNQAWVNYLTQSIKNELSTELNTMGLRYNAFIHFQ